jgi:hypothetical protein
MQQGFALEYVKNSSQPLHLITGKDANGADVYHVVMMDMIKLESLKRAGGNIDLKDFCVVLLSRFGTMPDEEVKREMLEKYGFDVDKHFTTH